MLVTLESRWVKDITRPDHNLVFIINRLTTEFSRELGLLIGFALDVTFDFCPLWLWRPTVGAIELKSSKWFLFDGWFWKVFSTQQVNDIKNTISYSRLSVVREKKSLVN